MNYKNWDKLVELFEFKKNISIFFVEGVGYPCYDKSTQTFEKK